MGNSLLFSSLVFFWEKRSKKSGNFLSGNKVFFPPHFIADLPPFLFKLIKQQKNTIIITATNLIAPEKEPLLMISPSQLSHGADHLFGREEELARLDKAWNDPNTHLVTIIAWGGVGKTALASHWRAGLAKRNYDGASYFDWSFSNQGTREQDAASADTFIKAALLFFGDKKTAESAAPWDKGTRLAELVSKRRTLLILDGIESLQHPPGPMAGQLKDPALLALLKGLAQKNQGLCVVTTRERATDLNPFTDTTVRQWNLKHLSVPVGVTLLKQLGVHSTEEEIIKLVEDVKGNALTLNLLGRYLVKAQKSGIPHRDPVKFNKADATLQGGQAFKMLAAYEQWFSHGEEDEVRGLAILRVLGLFDKPADAGCMKALCKPPIIKGLSETLVGIQENDWNRALSSLAEYGLISLQSDQSGIVNPQSPIDSQPLIREYFARQLSIENPKAWREAHHRLYKYLTTSTIDKPEPTLEELQPLYQAIAHGCKAGLQQEVCKKVYIDRVLKGTGSDGFYASKNLRALGACLSAVACFFENPWKKLATELSETDRTRLYNEAAFFLRSLGRLYEALDPTRAALSMAVSQKNWKNAGAGANNLCELELTLGDIEAAVRYGRQCVEFADKSGDAFWKMGSRTTLADSLHQQGKVDEALALFREAENMQAERQPECPLLYSWRGFRYCDLLLAEAEQSAWQERRTRESGIKNWELRSVRNETVDCREVERRAKETLRWWEEVFVNASLFDIALDHLTLGRTSLYLSILDPSDSVHRQSAMEDINTALGGLRSLDYQYFLPRGFLTRAWLRFLENDPTGSRADLDAAQQIAEHGSMRLHLADVHLYRGRLFDDKEEIKKARALIEKWGYWRRIGELEDAERELGI
jgi:tetratricopeptide (TPR) repeat protein